MREAVPIAAAWGEGTDALQQCCAEPARTGALSTHDKCTLEPPPLATLTVWCCSQHREEPDAHGAYANPAHANRAND